MSSQLLWARGGGGMQKESSIFQGSNGFGKWGPLGENVVLSSPWGLDLLKSLLLDTSSDILGEPSTGFS